MVEEWPLKFGESSPKPCWSVPKPCHRVSLYMYNLPREGWGAATHKKYGTKDLWIFGWFLQVKHFFAWVFLFHIGPWAISMSQILAGWWFGTCFTFSQIGNKSSQVTFIFFKGVGIPPTRVGLAKRFHVDLVVIFTDRSVEKMPWKNGLNSHDFTCLLVHRMWMVTREWWAGLVIRWTPYTLW